MSDNIVATNEIHEKHPEIKTFDDIYAQMPELLKTLSANPSNKKVEIHEALFQIIRAFLLAQDYKSSEFGSNILKVA